jgi:glycosyltransferase involved in cell wall biosynthesis
MPSARGAPADGASPVSVILPNMNHAGWLPRSLGALVSQVPAPLEIIVVDDASTDNSVEVIESFRTRHASIRLLRHEVNRGAVAAVKTALKEAKGEFLLFAAADDFVLPGLLARAVTALNTHPQAAFSCSELAIIDRDDKVVGFRPIAAPRRTSGYVSPADVRREILRTDNWIVGPSIVYRRSILQDLGYFDETLGTLGDGLTTHLLAFRHGFCFQAEVLATWRVYSTSLSAKSSLSLAENRRLLQVGADWITRHFPDDVRDSYRKLFDRRLRFNMARHWLLWSDRATGGNAIADLLDWGRFDRAVIRLLGHLPQMSSTFILAWMTLRLRPFSLRAMLGSWWHNNVVQRGRRASLARELVGEAPPATRDAPPRGARADEPPAQPVRT